MLFSSFAQVLGFGNARSERGSEFSPLLSLVSRV
jgi:hypothetical protein